MRHRTCRPLDLHPPARDGLDNLPRMRVCSPLIPSCGISSTKALLDLRKSVFTEPDVVTETSVDREGRMYSADLGAALPTDTADLDPAVWRPAHKYIALLTGRVDEQREA
jgi:hypothetical protein